MRLLFLGLCLALCACSQPPNGDSVPSPGSGRITSDAADQVSKAIGAGLQGDARTAIELLTALDPSKLSEPAGDYRRCMLARFGDSTLSSEVPVQDKSFAGQIVDTYIHYWRQSLLAPHSRDAFTLQLEGNLRRHLDLDLDADNVAIEETIRKRLNAQGLGVLLGQTGVLRELMIWRQEDRRSEAVKMPHGNYTTEVAYLDDFIISGWGQYATCETRGAGGWVADRTLFAVVPRYRDLDGEEFRVTFLGHETQHFLDLDDYPNMLSWELEYRAKLMELAMAEETRSRVLQKFIEDQGDDPASPHSYANSRILNELMTQLAVSNLDALRSVDGKRLRVAAHDLFKVDTAQRRPYQ